MHRQNIFITCLTKLDKREAQEATSVKNHSRGETLPVHVTRYTQYILEKEDIGVESVPTFTIYSGVLDWKF